MNIVELMSAIEKRPGHFLQKDCIFQLRAFLRGYCFAKNVSGGTKELSISQDHRLLTEFDSLIKSKFGYSEKGISVEEILYEKFGKQAFHTYFELWKSHTTKS